jgi:hypothetical protein
MRVVSIFLSVLLISTTASSGFAETGSRSAVFNRITQEAMASIVRDAGYRAEILKGKDSRYIRTAMSGYKVGIYFYDCNDDGCAALQFSTLFDKAPNLTVHAANDWNRQHRYARAYFDASDESFLFEYDFVVTGVTPAFIKDNLSLYEGQLGKLVKEVQ